MRTPIRVWCDVRRWMIRGESGKDPARSLTDRFLRVSEPAVHQTAMGLSPPDGVGMKGRNVLF